MAARVLAFLAALGMVAAALAVRAALDSDSTDGPNGGGDGSVLVCARELGDLCAAVDADVVEPANATADRLIDLGRDDDAGLGAWLVPGPWPQMVDSVRTLNGDRALFADVGAVAWSPLVVVTRGGALDEQCAADWNCVADGAVDGGHTVGAPAVTDATGVLARAAALSARVGTTDYGTEVFEEHSGWLAALTEALDRRQFQAGTLQRFLTIPGSADAFLTTRAAAEVAGAEQSARPAPVVHVPLTLGLRKGADRPDDLGEHADELGWSAAPTAAPLESGLPSPDVLYALREFL